MQGDDRDVREEEVTREWGGADDRVSHDTGRDGKMAHPFALVEGSETHRERKIEVR